MNIAGQSPLMRWIFKILKIWVYFFFFALLGQIRYESTTLESRFHSYINAPAQAQFFAKLLSPVHTILDLVGYPINTRELHRIQNQDIPKEMSKSPFFKPEKMEQMKKNMEERQRILKEADQP